MALTWQWDEKCGEAFLTQNFDGKDLEFKCSLYEGNAFMIMLHEYEYEGREVYDMKTFWLDKQHMKNCLGLNKKDKESRNIYVGGFDTFTKFRFNKDKSRHWKDIVPALAQAFDNITIELFTEKE